MSRLLFVLITIMLGYLLFVTTYTDEIYNSGKVQLNKITQMGLLNGNSQEKNSLNRYSLTNCNSILWRYDLEYALKCTLNESELDKVKSISLALKGSDLEESVWNISMFLEYLDYDMVKANMPNPELVFYSNGKIEVVKGKDNIFQTPYETIMMNRGVCRDFAILSLSLLLNQYHDLPLYYLQIEFENTSFRHASAGLEINGTMFVIDQHIPPIDLASYYKKWMFIDGRKIKRITLHPIGGRHDEIELTEFRGDYDFSDRDLKKIEFELSKFLSEKFKLKEDERLKTISSKTLPSGYLKGNVWTLKSPAFCDYYHPIFHRQHLKKIEKEILENTALVKSLNSSKGIWVSAKTVKEKMCDLEVEIYLGL
jgi:hypothetical protein